MALPRFEKSGLSTVTFSRAYLANSGRAAPKPRQLVTRTDGGSYGVVTLGPPEQQLPLQWQQIPLADIVAVDAFLGPTGVNFAAETFTWVDTDASETLVRCLDYSYEAVTPESFNLTVLLVVEPT